LYSYFTNGNIKSYTNGVYKSNCAIMQGTQLHSLILLCSRKTTGLLQTKS